MNILLKLSLGALLTGACLPLFADDTEIYINQNNAVGKRPKVLIIFDNSGSMGTAVTPTENRIQIARRVVKNVIDANPGVDFGLAIFNDNDSGSKNPRNGGRIVRGITENQTAQNRTDLKTTVDGLSALTWTPLCETLSEAYRYYAGLKVAYGDDDSTASPARDLTIESNGSYISPLTDCEQAYVILMTDGEPTRDTSADAFIDALPEIGTPVGNRLDELAGWLNKKDVDQNDSNGEQHVTTYTIGFQTDHPLLAATAEAGGGDYFTAENADQLTDAFQSAISKILGTSASFTSPSIAVNSFNRTRSLNSVYMAMFQPESTPRWAGNIKKLTLNASGQLLDANGKAAINSDTGNIVATATTIWSAPADGDSVKSGGAGGLLAARDPSTRTIKINTGTNEALEDFKIANTKLTAALLGAGSDSERDVIVNWVRGVDVFDEDNDKSTTDTRWILGDPLHSQPLVINYGARGSYTKTNPDTRIVVGTNAGFLHMFSGDDGGEDWAFTPKEFASLHKTLLTNKASVSHPYAIDGTPVAYIYDKNNDGTISGSDDKVYLYFGLQRGGNGYYALDISDPDKPQMLWHIDTTTPGFDLLGQSWSTPTLGRIGGFDGPVLFFAGGFDPNKDSAKVGTADKMGQGVYIVDAIKGALIWSATPGAKSTTNLEVKGLDDSMPAPVAAVDSNGDKNVDRLYATDTGGNIWRLDIPGNVLPDASQDKWSMFKFAKIGVDGKGTKTTPDDRRFYHAADVVQTRDGGVNYDAIAIGSGNLSHPMQTTTTDRFYLFRDLDVNSSFHGSGGTAIPDPLLESDLYDATADLVQVGTASERTSAAASIAKAKGWYITLEGKGEKNLSSSVTLGGMVFFTTFTPSEQETLCKPAGGTGTLYAVSLHNANSVLHFVTAQTSDLTKDDRKFPLKSRLPSSVTPHFGDDGIRILGVGAGQDGSGSIATGASLTTTGTYWYRQAN